MPHPQAQLQLRPFLELAANMLQAMNCDLIPRAFDPPEVPALYLVGRQAIAAEEMRAARGSANTLWSGVIETLDKDGASARPQLVLNLRNPVIRKITAVTDPHLASLGVQALYGQALLQGHHLLRANDTVVLNRAFLGLLESAMFSGGSR